MNSSFNLLIKLLMVLVIVLIAVVVLFVAKATNIDFDDLKKDEPVQTQNIKKSTKELSDEEIKKINDSLEQRENRIKSLKEVGKNLGG